MTSASGEELERMARGVDDAALLALADSLDAEGRHADAINQLALAAQHGCAEALGRLGQRLLLGYRAPRMPEQGVGLIADGARGGSASAAALMATLTGFGAYCTQSWGEALDWLRRAAEHGSDFARGQLVVLAGDRAMADEARAAGADAPADLWSRLRLSVDLVALTTAPPARTLCDGPAIRSYDGFADPQTCDWLIGRARERLRRAMVYDATGQRGEAGQSRTNSIAAFYLHEIDLVQLLMQARVSSATGIPFSHMEAPAVLHYSVGQIFDDHYDFVDPATPGYRQLIAREGERVITFLVYLNDDYDGGETVFPKLGVRHKGVRGQGFSFSNALPSGEPDVRALHAGRPPTRGEKWVVSGFVRSRPYVPGVAGA